MPISCPTFTPAVKRMKSPHLKLFLLIGVLGVTLSGRAQYPRISPEIAAEANARQAAADKLSDEAFGKALPIIKEWEAKGKPWLPGAAQPKDLPQAKIP